MDYAYTEDCEFFISKEHVETVRSILDNDKTNPERNNVLLDYDTDGNIDSICFQGYYGSAVDSMFESIASYVKEGSYIEMKRDDGVIWRYYYTGGKCKEIHPEVKTSWPDMEK